MIAQDSQGLKEQFSPHTTCLSYPFAVSFRLKEEKPIPTVMGNDLTL